MSNNANQNQTNERKIYLKDLHQWVPVSKTDYDNYYRDINAYQMPNSHIWTRWHADKAVYST